MWSTTFTEADELLKLPEAALFERIHQAFHRTYAEPASEGLMSTLASWLPRPSFISGGVVPEVPTFLQLDNRGNRAAFPLQLVLAKEYTRPRCVLVG